jgi:hypothetical protein
MFFLTRIYVPLTHNAHTLIVCTVTSNIKTSLANFTKTVTTSDFECKRCQKRVDAALHRKCGVPPPLLLLHLLRFSQESIKKTDHVAFEQLLDLSFILSAPHEKVYSLSSVVVHVGDTMESGHYYAYVLVGSGTWYKMDDNRVSVVTWDEVRKDNAYMLVYAEASPSIAAQEGSVSSGPTVACADRIIKEDGAEDDFRAAAETAENACDVEHKLLQRRLNKTDLAQAQGAKDIGAAAGRWKTSRSHSTAVEKEGIKFNNSPVAVRFDNRPRHGAPQPDAGRDVVEYTKGAKDIVDMLDASFAHADALRLLASALEEGDLRIAKANERLVKKLPIPDAERSYVTDVLSIVHRPADCVHVNLSLSLAMAVRTLTRGRGWPFLDVDFGRCGGHVISKTGETNFTALVMTKQTDVALKEAAPADAQEMITNHLKIAIHYTLRDSCDEERPFLSLANALYLPMTAVLYIGGVKCAITKGSAIDEIGTFPNDPPPTFDVLRRRVVLACNDLENDHREYAKELVEYKNGQLLTKPTRPPNRITKKAASAWLRVDYPDKYSSPKPCDREASSNNNNDNVGSDNDDAETGDREDNSDSSSDNDSVAGGSEGSDNDVAESGDGEDSSISVAESGDRVDSSEGSVESVAESGDGVDSSDGSVEIEVGCGSENDNGGVVLNNDNINRRSLRQTKMIVDYEEMSEDSIDGCGELSDTAVPCIGVVAITKTEAAALVKRGWKDESDLLWTWPHSGIKAALVEGHGVLVLETSDDSALGLQSMIFGYHHNDTVKAVIGSTGGGSITPLQLVNYLNTNRSDSCYLRYKFPVEDPAVTVITSPLVIDAGPGEGGYTKFLLNTDKPSLGGGTSVTGGASAAADIAAAEASDAEQLVNSRLMNAKKQKISHTMNDASSVAAASFSGGVSAAADSAGAAASDTEKFFDCQSSRGKAAGTNKRHISQMSCGAGSGSAEPQKTGDKEGAVTPSLRSSLFTRLWSSFRGNDRAACASTQRGALPKEAGENRLFANLSVDSRHYNNIPTYCAPAPETEWLRDKHPNEKAKFLNRCLDEKFLIRTIDRSPRGRIRHPLHVHYTDKGSAINRSPSGRIRYPLHVHYNDTGLPYFARRGSWYPQDDAVRFSEVQLHDNECYDDVGLWPKTNNPNEQGQVALIDGSHQVDLSSLRAFVAGKENFFHAYGSSDSLVWNSEMIRIVLQDGVVSVYLSAKVKRALDNPNVICLDDADVADSGDSNKKEGAKIWFCDYCCAKGVEVMEARTPMEAEHPFMQMPHSRWTFVRFESKNLAILPDEKGETVDGLKSPLLVIDDYDEADDYDDADVYNEKGETVDGLKSPLLVIDDYDEAKEPSVTYLYDDGEGPLTYQTWLEKTIVRLHGSLQPRAWDRVAEEDHRP